MRLFDVFSYNDDRLVTESLNVQQLAAKSDEALDNAYHYGRSTPGNTFGWQANLASAAYAKEIIDSGETDINKISDAVHKGWWSVAQKFVDDPDQFSDTEALRAKGKFDKKMADRIAQMVPFNELTKDQQDIDRVVAEALLQAITGGGEQGVAEGNFGPAATAAIQQGKSPSDVAYADTKDINNIAKGLKIQQQVATGDDPTLTNAGNAARRAGNTTVEDVAEGTGQVEAYGYRYNNRDQRVVWRKNFPSSEAAYAWADKNNATVIGVRAAEKAVDEAFRLGNKRLGTKRDRFKSIHRPSLVETEPTHRIGVTVTDPNHPMVSKRGETIQKSIRVTHADRDAAINRAIAHYRRKGYKVHDHHYMGTVEPGVAEGILGSDPNRGQKVPGWAKGGIIGKIGRKLDPAWSDIQMTVPQHLLSKQSSVPATNSPATKDIPKVKATSIIPTRAIPKRAGNNSSHSVPKNVVKTIADKQGVAEGSEEAEAYKAHLIKTMPQMMNFLSKKVKGWTPSEEEMLSAIDTAYMVMKHTGDVKQAGKAMMDELNTLHRMSQGQQGVAEAQLNELDMWAPATTFIKMTDGSYVQADWRRHQFKTGLDDAASFINFKPVNPTVAKQLGLDSHQRNNSVSGYRSGTLARGGDYQGSGPLSTRGYEVVDYNKPETMEELPDEIKPELIKWIQKQGVAEGLPGSLSKSDYTPGATKKHVSTNCTTCHGRKGMYKLDGKLFADNKVGAVRVKCPTCKGTGDKPGVAEAKTSAAVRLGRAIDRTQGKTAASQARSVIPSSIPKKEEPKQDEKKVDEGIQAGDGFIIECGDSAIETVVLGNYLDGILIEFDHTATFMLTDAGITLTEAEYHGRTVPLGKRMAGDVKKSKVYVKKPNGNVVKVNFGDKNMTIKKHLPKHRKSYRARHHCENPGPKWKANYWSCRAW